MNQSLADLEREVVHNMWRQIDMGLSGPIAVSYGPETFEWSELRSSSYGERIHLTNQPTREGNTMQIEINQPLLTEEDNQKLKRFYKEVLSEGKGSWPLGSHTLILWINGIPRRVYYASRWELKDDLIRIGYSYDEGIEELANPVNRFAIIMALMNLTGHSRDFELLALAEARLSKVLVQTYQGALAPLGQRSDRRPVERIAWSQEGGLAAELDGEWVRPLTGEPVNVSGWTVVDIATDVVSDVREESKVEVETAQETPEQAYRRAVEDDVYAEVNSRDGRKGIYYATNEAANANLFNLTSRGYNGLVVEHWGLRCYVITYPAQPSEFPLF
jgi:hypothetical protein